MTEHEWTDWKDHDGMGVPAELKVGMIFQSEDYYKGIGLVMCIPMVREATPGRSWDWSNYPIYTKVMRYRIRKPRALQAMIERAAALPVVKHLEQVQ